MMMIRIRSSFLSCRHTFFHSCNHIYALNGWIGLKGASKLDMRTRPHQQVKMNFQKEGMTCMALFEFEWNFLSEKFILHHKQMELCFLSSIQMKQYGFVSHGVQLNDFYFAFCCCCCFHRSRCSFACCSRVRYVAYHSIFSHQSSSHRCGMAPPLPPTTVDENEKMIA